MHQINYLIKKYKCWLCAIAGVLFITIIAYPKSAIIIISTAVASFGGALAAFYFEKNERNINKKNDEYNQLLILKTYFEDELNSLYLDLQQIDDLLKNKKEKYLVPLESILKIKTNNMAFILESDSQLFKDIVATIRVHKEYREGLKTQSFLIETILSSEAYASNNIDKIINILELQRENAQNNLELTQNTFNSLNKYLKKHFAIH